MTPEGLLVIDKPLGWSSMRVCAVVRAKLRNGGAPKRIKVGHGGTLDPLATGVLVVLVGKATKHQAGVMVGEKAYTAQVDLAHRSQTDDAEGPIEQVATEPISRARLEAALPAFVGDIQQRPPAFSAMKIGGRRAYALARQAETESDLPVLEPRPVTIHAVTLSAYDWPIATLEVRCGKGTYIRSLARDLGASLGAGGMLRGLRRTRVGRWTIDQAVDPRKLPQALTQQDLRSLDAT